MAANKTRLYLLAYDIADPRRLTQVHRTVRAVGAPLQYSVSRGISAIFNRTADVRGYAKADNALR